MTVQLLDIKTSINIQKPINEVFEAIVDNNKMSNYFISSSTGRMETGMTLTWQFPEFDVKFPVRVGNIEKDKYISYYWDTEVGKETFVEFNLKKKSDNDTNIVITEKSRENNEAGLKWLKGNTEGWANFLACLKAFLEFGINLRKGSFEPERLSKEFSDTKNKK